MVICQAHADWLLSRIHMGHADVSSLISERSGEHRCSITYDLCTCVQVSQFSLLAIQQALECKTGSRICHQHTITVSGKCWASSRGSVCCAEAWPAWQPWTSLLAAVGSAAACTRPALQRPSGALSMSSRLPRPSSTISQLYIALAASADDYIIILWPEIMTVRSQWTSCLSLRQGFSDQTDVPDKSNAHVGGTILRRTPSRTTAMCSSPLPWTRPASLNSAMLLRRCDCSPCFALLRMYWAHTCMMEDAAASTDAAWPSLSHLLMRCHLTLSLTP